MNINLFLNDLADNSSRNYKIEQLEKNQDNEVLRNVVRLALDPFTQFYQRKIPAYKRNNKPAIALGYALDELYVLSSRQKTGNDAIAFLSDLLSQLEADDAKVIERIIQKDLKCGVQVSTANAVWMGLIREYPVMLCSPFEQKLVDKIKFPAAVQLKMDGMRFNAIVREGKVDFRSRNGKEIQLLGNLEAEFLEMAEKVGDCVFDGELLVKQNGKILDRQTGNGILNKANKGTISAKEAAMVHATIWDVIPYILFETGEADIPYSKRFASLQKIKLPTKIQLVPHTVVNSYDEAQQLFQKYHGEGQEGIILKDLNGSWEDKRAKHQIKFKGELECDLKIVAIEEGTGKYEGMLGAIVCESSDGKVKVNVGSGFTDEHRKNFGKEILDKIVAIKYNARIKNKQGEESLFLPIFIELRDDKTVADSSKVIK